MGMIVFSYIVYWRIYTRIDTCNSIDTLEKKPTFWFL